MKLYIKYIILALVFTACNNDDDNNNGDPLSQLPPMTTTGENTIGCLVNGEPFTDSGLMNNFYQFVDGEYVLVINWNENNSGNTKRGQIAIQYLEINENQNYTLDKSFLFDGDVEGGFGTYTSSENDSNGGNEYLTNDEFSGIVNFSRFDNINNIMSGTFEFQAREITTVEIITITDGRFDLTFTN